MRAYVLPLALIGLSCGSDNKVGVYNTPPSASVTAPPSGSEYLEAEVIEFEALVHDDQDDDAELKVSWASDRDGAFEGGSVEQGYARFSTANLSPGNHVVTVLVADTGGEASTANVTVVVADLPDAPEITIVHPVTNETAVESQGYTFEAKVEDSFDLPEELLVSFVTDQAQGEFCTPVPDTFGKAACDADLSPGQHLLTFTVTDTEGFSASATTYFGVIGLDNDGDGHINEEYGGEDCDDDEEDVYPGATETCNERDDDCDNIVDEGTSCYDDDGDGFTEIDGDCDDESVYTYPGATEIEDNEDNDCDGIADEGTNNYDDDGDSYSENGGDCNDSDAAVNPGATESCDGIDNDCDSSVDEEGASGCSNLYYDGDGDGFGTTSGKCLCSSSGYYTSSYNNDCYDSNANANPGASSYSSSHRGDTSYDWNCDGSEQKYWGSSGGCSGAVWVCTTTQGWQSGVASCGNNGAYITSCSGFLCGASTSTYTQKCL